LIDQERVIPEEILAELIKCLSHCGLLDGAPNDVDSLRRYAHFYNNEELGRVEAFLHVDPRKLIEYEEQIKEYHDLAARIPIEVERTVFAGLFEVCRASFVQTIVENIQHFKGILLQYLIDKYQNLVTR